MNIPLTPVPPFEIPMPFLECSLSSESARIRVSALVDSGATLNIMPYEIGEQLGLVWSEQRLPLDMGGTLGGTRAFAVSLHGQIGSFPPVEMIFAWVERSNIRMLLGHVNFFQLFRVTFDDKAGCFHIAPA
jgi:hypothetical protein